MRLLFGPDGCFIGFRYEGAQTGDEGILNKGVIYAQLQIFLVIV